MGFLLQFHPRNFFLALREIDDEAAAERACLAGPDKRPAIILVAAALCLFVTHHLSSVSYYHKFIAILSLLTGQTPVELYAKLGSIHISRLAMYAWWCFGHFVGYLLIPALVIKWLLRDSVRDYGLTISGLLKHTKWYVYLIILAVLSNTLASFREDFASFYPFYRLASRSWADLLAWESIYLAQFVFLEFFFRGFMLFGCKRSFGSNAIFVMCVPYVMIHFTKPWIESFGSLLFGIVISVLVLRSRSIWGAVLVHYALALSLDLMALMQTRGLPAAWWP